MSNAYDPAAHPQGMSSGYSAPSADGGRAVAPYSSQSPYASAASGPQPGFQQAGFQQPGFQQAGFQQAGFQQPAQAAYAQGQPGQGYQQAYYPGTAPVPGQGGYQQPGAYYDQKSKVAAGLLGIFLGTLGVHNFYLGYTGKAVGQLVGTIVGVLLWILLIGVFIFLGIWIWALIEGILILCAQPGSRPWGVDARGVPLSS